MKNKEHGQIAKLIVITRQDLSPGSQAIQASHAAIDFQHDHPEISKVWNINSNYLVFLSVKNEKSLLKFLYKIKSANLKYTVFNEPDLKNQLTAVAIEPSEQAGKMCSNLPLALKEY